MAQRLRIAAFRAAREVAQGAGLRVLWSGSRAWADTAERRELLSQLVLPVAYGLLDAVPDRLGFMGGAARGLDRFIHDQTQNRPAFRAVTPERYPIMPGETPLNRDRRMIENKPGMVIGVPHPESKSGGTWHCLRLAYRAGIPTYVLRGRLGVGPSLERYRPHAGRQAEALF